jgi:uncharacterized protein YbjT (DUF2867 family)
MPDKKVIAVVGATGQQGNGLVRAILADQSGTFAARALTRDTTSVKARELAALGAQVVAANVDDPASLRAAFQGAYAAYCVTFFWNHFSVDQELAQARAQAAAAKAAGVKHAIWSTLEDTRKWVPLDDNRIPTLHGKYKVPHFDGKGEADQFFRDAGVPTTFLLTSFYYDNFIYFGSGPKKMPDGQLAVVFPMADKKLPMIAADDIGRCAYGIFQRGPEFIGRTVGIAGDKLTGAQIAEACTLALGQDIRYQYVPPEQYRKLGFPGADDLGNMFQFKRDFEDYFCGVRSVEFSRMLNPELQSFRDWLDNNKARIPMQ